MRQLEGGEAALVFSSGMAAGAAVLQSLSPGSHVIFPEDMYVDFRNLIREYLPKWGIETTTLGTEMVERVGEAIRPDTRLVWLESPSNPLLKV